MKTPQNQAGNGQTIALSTAGLRFRLAMVIGWSILAFLLAISLASQPAQAQGNLSEPLPDGVTMTHSTKYDRKTLTFKVNKPHSLLRYYDRIGTSWDNSGGSCYKNRVWFDYYLANVYDDTEPIRQSHDYTFYEREEGAKICLLIVFDDWRDGGGGTNPNGPFSFDQDQTNPPVITNPPVVIDPPVVTKPVITKKTISGTVAYDQNLELPDGSKMLIELRDTTASLVVTKKAVTNLANPPLSFNLNYKTKDIKERNTYDIQIKVVDTDGNQLLRNDVSVDVITHNNPTNVHVSLVPTRHLTQLQTDDTEDQTDDSGQETEQQTEPPAQGFKKPLPLQMRSSQRSTEKPQPQPEPESIDQAPEETVESTSQEPEALVEHTPEPTAPEQPALVTITIEEPLVTEPAVTEHQTKKSDNSGSDLIWLGAYIVAVLAVGAISLLLLNKKDR